MNIWGIVASVGLAAIGSVVDYLGVKDTNKSNQKNVNATNEANLQLAELNNSEQMRRLLATQQFDVDQWNRNNAYNSFAAQMQRARDAGLNPQGVVNNNASTQVTSQQAPAPVTPTMQPFQKQTESLGLKDALQNAFDNVKDLFEMKRETKQDFRDQESHDADMRDKAEETKGRLISNAKTAEERRKAAAEARNMENEIDRAKERHEKEMRKTEKEIESLDQGITESQEKIKSDAARLQLEQAAQKISEKLAEANINVSKAQQSQIYNAIDLAKKTFKHQSEIHDKEMRSRQLDNDLKELNSMVQASDLPKKMIFDQIMRERELFHDDLKNNSEINMIMERAFGLGFRDLGNALKGLVNLVK